MHPGALLSVLKRSMRKIVGALLLVAMAACHPEQGAATPHPDGGPYKDLVAEHRNQPLDERLAVFRPMAKELSLDCMPRSKRSYLDAFARDLVLARDLEVLDALERDLDDPDRKRAFWSALSSIEEEPEARTLLQEWAQSNPGAIILARFRPGGLEFLLEQLEDATLRPLARAWCANELARGGDASVIPRLRKWVDDETPVRSRSMRAGSGVPTLGQSVQRTIDRLEASG